MRTVGEIVNRASNDDTNKNKALRVVRYRIEFIKFGIDKFEILNRLRFAIELRE